MDLFIELSCVIVIAALISALMRLLKQPLVVGFILTGIIAGPYGLGIMHSVEAIEAFSKIGIATLLFIVGLGLNPLVVKEIGISSLVTGIGQVIFTFVFGFFLSKFLGFADVSAIYISIALTFSSTIVVMKLLSDKGDIHKLYGRLAIGFLLVQDVVATIILVIVSATSGSGGESFSQIVSGLIINGIVVTVVLFFVSRYILHHLSNFFALSQEMLFIFSMAWGLGLATLFYKLGFSIEIGALIAGVTLSVSPFAYEIAARIKPLRDFFILIFFTLLGSQMILGDISTNIIPAIILSIFVLVGNPLIVYIVMNILGFKRKVSFMSGLTVAQVSEFSLILIALAYNIGHVDRNIVSLVTLVGAITIAGSSYLIIFSDEIYRIFEKVIKFIEFRKKPKREHFKEIVSKDIIIFGYDRVGEDFVKAAEKLGGSFVVVDFNPASIKKLQEKNVPFMYGDAEDGEFLNELDLKNTKLIISTIPEFKASLFLVHSFRKENPNGIILVLANEVMHAEKLYLAGASYVVMPHHLGAHFASNLISKNGFDPLEFEKERNLHLTRLSKKHV